MASNQKVAQNKSCLGPPENGAPNEVTSVLRGCLRPKSPLFMHSVVFCKFYALSVGPILSKTCLCSSFSMGTDMGGGLKHFIGVPKMHKPIHPLKYFFRIFLYDVYFGFFFRLASLFFSPSFCISIAKKRREMITILSGGGRQSTFSLSLSLSLSLPREETRRDEHEMEPFSLCAHTFVHSTFLLILLPSSLLTHVQKMLSCYPNATRKGREKKVYCSSM